MNLEELLLKSNSKAIFLINEDGDTIDFYPKKNDLGNLQDKIIAFNATVFNMSSHFLKNFLNSDLKVMVLRSDDKNILLIKHNEYILSFLSDKNINIGLLEMILKKEFNH